MLYCSPVSGGAKEHADDAGCESDGMPQAMNPGLHLHRGSRVEWLADRLAAQLDAEPLSHPLQPQQVVVAHPGLGRWLQQWLAERPNPGGGDGIAANLDFVLPGEWLQALMAALLEEPGLRAETYRPECLRWRLYELLPEIEAPELAHYLAADADPRRRFQLADHLAGLYAQYLPYRRDWVLDAQAGRERDWQARLWRRLREGILAPHRAERVDALLARLLEEAPARIRPVHVFGVNHLSPDVLAVFRACARWLPVHLYVPDPCREYWHDIVPERRLARAQAEAQEQYFEVGHPLLAALGRHGQAFLRQLEDLDAHYDARDPGDEADAGQASTLLSRLQDSLRRLQPELAAGEVAATDASLRVHGCHTRLRELEVLRDALLALLATHPDLDYRDIVVMAPDIAQYAPLVPAVFGEPGGDGTSTQLPYHLADRSLASRHPLLRAFLQLLALPSQRLSRSEVLGLLELPAVARRLGIGADGRDALARWLQRANAYWGLDAAMKAEFSGVPVDAHSLAFGRDRLFLGQIMGGADRCFDGVLPLEGVGGSDAEGLGALDRLLALLREGRQAMRGERPVADWESWLRDWIERLFQADPDDAEEDAALETLLQAVAGFGEESAQAGVDPLLPWAVVREALEQRLDRASPQQPWLGGGITFCGMVPARVIPFRVVCLLGLNDGEFPRPGAPSGLSLIERRPRPGDRDTRAEDRYLFLECLMSARQALHLSHLAAGATDGNPRNPAMPLAELLGFLDQAYGLEGDAPRPWRETHALQPFDARYFNAVEGGTRTQASYASALAPAAGVRGTGRPPPWIAFDAGIGPVAGEESLSLAELHGFWRDPSAYALSRLHAIWLAPLAEGEGEDCEPLTDRPDPRLGLPRRLLEACLREGAPPGEAPPDWLAASGLLPTGLARGAAWSKLREAVAPLFDWAREQGLVGAPAETLTVDLALEAGLRLQGRLVAPLVRAAPSPCLWRAVPGRGDVDDRDRLRLFIDYAAARLMRDAPLQVCLVHVGKRGVEEDSLVASWQTLGPAQLRTALVRLAHYLRLARRRPVPWLPKTSSIWAEHFDADPGRAGEHARQAWFGGAFSRGERDWRPPYAAWLLRGADPFDEADPAHAAFAEVAREVHALLRSAPDTEGCHD